MAMTIALPTDFDVFEAQASDAGELLLAMHAKQPKAFHKFLQTHKPQHKDPDGSDWDAHKQQEVWRCVEHLIKLLVRTVEFNTSAKVNAAVADGAIQAEEAAKFLRKRASGQHLEQVEGSLGDTDFFASMDNAASMIITTAAAMKIQMASRLAKARRKIAARKAQKARDAGEEVEEVMQESAEGAAAAEPDAAAV